MTKIRFALLVVIVALLGGCATTPPLNFSVPNVGYSQHKIDAEMKSLVVSVARPDQQTGPIPSSMEVQIAQLWKSSMEDALDRMAIFKDDAPKKVSLLVTILKLAPPAFGATMDTSTEARYQLVDRSTGSIIYTQTFTSDGVVPWNYAFAGAIRAKESVNRAVQNNITKFLQSLQTVNVNKPMFPVASGASQ